MIEKELHTLAHEKPENLTEENRSKRQLPSHLPSFFIGGFFLSLAIDILFWEKSFGFSFLIWVGLILLAAGVLAIIEGKRPHSSTYVLIAGVLLTAIMAVWRDESGTRAYNVLFTLLLLGLTSDSLLSGEAFHFRIGDAFLRLWLLVFAAFERPIQALTTLSENRKTHKKKVRPWRRVWLPVLRGILIAVPILLIFATLLSSADPVFEEVLTDFWAFLKIEDWGEFAFRTFYILVLGFCFSGLLLHAFSKKRYYQLPKKGISSFKPFLGKIESFTVLFLIILLFGLFIFIQFRYFFGGNSNINFAGYTYAEYARKGTEELIIVAILSLGLYQLLHTITRLEQKPDRTWMHFLMTVLIVEVLIILLSSYQRLAMYQLIYGFSRIRVRTHLFILWLSALLGLVILLEWTGKSRRFFIVLLFVSFGFVASQGFLNIDKHILEKNLSRLDENLPHDAWDGFDHHYLRYLSNDALPVIVDTAQDASLDEEVREMFLAELSCRLWSLEQEQANAPSEAWISQTPSSLRAKQLLLGLNKSNLPQLEDDEWESKGVWLQDGDMHYCLDYRWGWD
ncbi:MAG: DUF4173 domain-containing protein [Anaerolineaceae bacterium]|nr:DUF4173 domain-containing protein [Anaerolineaceae bacterium]